MREGADESALPQSRHKAGLEGTHHSVAVFGHVVCNYRQTLLKEWPKLKSSPRILYSLRLLRYQSRKPFGRLIDGQVRPGDLSAILGLQHFYLHTDSCVRLAVPHWLVEISLCYSLAMLKQKRRFRSLATELVWKARYHDRGLIKAYRRTQSGVSLQKLRVQDQPRNLKGHCDQRDRGRIFTFVRYGSRFAECRR